ncbi:hypothetical protein [Campylobacter troglodytis]|uniref:hypothetical protein n=1 Tax=Campylobacter troglodytis TaxID=654363 RepID=UPI001157D36E|nr:hypothetical protein [Campylobacter troglodytis]TQR60709.1 hypothetical protein DMC01_04670 [Campylobacter troglodytis]
MLIFTHLWPKSNFTHKLWWIQKLILIDGIRLLADMGIGEGYELSIYKAYYDLNSQLVLEQLNIHKGSLEK